MSAPDWSLEAWLARETHEWLTRYDATLDRSRIRYQENAGNAMKKVRPLLDHPRPLDPIRDLHQQILVDINALRTEDQLRTFEMVVLSELLCAFPLRGQHWPRMHVVHGYIPDDPPVDGLYVRGDDRDSAQSLYTIVVPTSGLKNEETSKVVRELDPPRYVYDLPSHLDEPLTRYLEEVRPRLVQPTSQSMFSSTPRMLGEHLKNFQERHLIGSLGLSRAWKFHPYRVLVATHAVKNATHNPFQVAASLLLDSETMVRSTYGRFRAEDAHDAAREAIAPLDSEARV